jgi:hypothetical protein
MVDLLLLLELLLLLLLLLRVRVRVRVRVLRVLLLRVLRVLLLRVLLLRVLRVLLLRVLRMLLLLMLLGWGRRRGQGRRSWRGRGSRGTGDPYWRRVCGEEVLEDREIRHGRVHHLLKVVVCKLGGDEVAAPEQVVAATAALGQLFLDVAYGAVHGERHAIARDDGIVDDVWVSELFVHHVQRLDDLEYNILDACDEIELQGRGAGVARTR